MNHHQHHITRILPYRLGAVEVLNLAVRYRLRWPEAVPMQVHFDGRLEIDGLSTAFTDPAIEAGIIHSRALLEFLGIGANPSDHRKLVSRPPPRRPDDLLIEHFSNSFGTLSRVTPAQAIAKYDGPAEEAERALARIIHVANKGLAHSTVGLIDDIEDLRLTEIASRGLRSLVVSYFYTPMGLQPPRELIKSRQRPIERPDTA